MKPEGYCLRLESNGPAAPDPASHRHDIRAQAFGPALSRVDLGPHGLVLGTLFDAAGRQIRTVTPSTARRWCDTSGTALLRDNWGRYLAILQVEDGLLVMRDPSGAFPCYWQQQGDAVLLASDLAWGEPGKFAIAGIDWAEIRTQLQYRHRRSTRTAFSGVKELLPGCGLLLVSGRVEQVVLWSPYAHARWQADLSFKDAANRVRSAVRQTLTAEAGLCRRPLIALSGGLDSSIVTACFAEANPASECVAFQGGDADLDEIGYARAVADHCGLSLHQARLSGKLVDLTHSAAADLPYPNARSFSQAEDRQARVIAEQHGSDAFILGNGGDTIFWYFNTATAAVDRLRAQGLCAALATTGDLARMCDVPRTTILRSAFGKLARHAPMPWPRSTFLLGAAGFEPAEPPPHPWENAPAGTPLGVHAYVRALIQLQAHHGYFDRAEYAPVRSVLMAQPIYEACLSVPSWLSSEDGRNRAVARAAFADFLPRETIARQSKGGFDGFVHQMLAANRPVAQSMLLEGILAERRIIDRVAIEALFRNPVAITGEAALRLLRFVAVEAWLRHQVARGRG